MGIVVNASQPKMAKILGVTPMANCQKFFRKRCLQKLRLHCSIFAPPPPPHYTPLQPNQCVYATATVILEMHGYKIKTKNVNECLPWRRRLEGKIREAQRDISQLTEVQNGIMSNRSWVMKYNSMSICETLKTVKQRLKALESKDRRDIREPETKGINSLFPKEPSTVYSKLQGNNSRNN